MSKFLFFNGEPRNSCSVSMIYSFFKAYKRWRILPVISLSVIILAIDQTVMDLALPSISRDLQAGIKHLQWVVNAYVIALCTPLLAIGSIADRVGRKKVLQVGLIIFGIVSLVAAITDSINTLIMARALLGLAAAMILPSTLAIITAEYTEPKDRARAIAIWAGIYSVGAGIGPIVGGIIMEYFSWHAIFLLNVPIAILALTGGYIWITESKNEQTFPPDLPGVVLSMLALFTLVFGIIEAGGEGVASGRVLIPLGSSLVFVVVFILWEAKTPYPMLPVVFFKNPSFLGANLALTLAMFSLAGPLFVVSQYLQSVQGYSPLGAAIRLLPFAPVEFGFIMLSVNIARKIGVKFTVGGGIFLMGIGLLCMSQWAKVDTPYLHLLAVIGVLAAGIGLAFGPGTDSVMGSVPPERSGIASAINDTTQQFGAALGVAVLGALINATYQSRISAVTDLLQLAPENSPVILEGIQQAQNVAAGYPVGVAQQITLAANEAFVSGMTSAMFVGAVIMFVASFVTVLILPMKIRQTELP